MNNITNTLREGYKLAKTPLQQAKVMYWHDKVDRKVAKINAMIDELEKPDPRWEAYKKRNGIK